MPQTWQDFPTINWGLINQAGQTTGGDPNQGTYVRLPDGTFQYFEPGQNPKAYMGDSIPGGAQWAVPGTDQANHLERLLKTGTNQAAIKIGALVGGAAALGGTAWGSGGASSATNYGTGFASASDAAAGSVAPAIGESTAGSLTAGADTIGAALEAHPALMGAANLFGVGPPSVGAAGGGMAGASWLNWANLGSTILGTYGADRAADAQGDRSDASITESGRQFDTARGDVLPAIQLGQHAVGQLDALNHGDMSGFTTSPDYQFNLSEGQKAIDRKLSAMGLSNSGPAVKESGRFASGLAANQYGSFYDRLLASAGLGTTGAATSANAGANSASLIGSANQVAGNARASGYANMYGALQGGVQNALLQRYLGL